MCDCCNPGLMKFMRSYQSRRNVLAGLAASLAVAASRPWRRPQNLTVHRKKPETIFLGRTIYTMNDCAAAMPKRWQSAMQDRRHWSRGRNSGAEGSRHQGRRLRRQGGFSGLCRSAHAFVLLRASALAGHRPVQRSRYGQRKAENCAMRQASSARPMASGQDGGPLHHARRALYVCPTSTASRRMCRSSFWNRMVMSPM